MTVKKKRKARPAHEHQIFAWEPTEVSFVSRAGNRRKLITHRSAKDKSVTYHPTPEARVIERLKHLDPAIERKIQFGLGKRLVQKDATDGGVDDPMDEEALAALKGAARTLAAYSDSLTMDDLMNMGREIGLGDDGDEVEADDGTGDDTGDDGIGSIEDDDLTQSEDGDMAITADSSTASDAPKGESVDPGDILDNTMTKPDGVSDADHAAAMKAAKDAYDKALADSGAVTTRSDEPELQLAQEQSGEGDEPEPKPEDEDEATVSTLTEAQRAEVAKMVADAGKELQQKSADMAKELASQRERNLSQHYSERAQKYAALGLPTENIAALLRSAHGNAKQLAAIESSFSALSEQNSEAGRRGGNLFGQRGSSQGAQPGSAEEKIEALVSRVTERSDDKRTYEQRYAAALRTPEGRKLYEQMNARES